MNSLTLFSSIQFDGSYIIFLLFFLSVFITSTLAVFGWVNRKEHIFFLFMILMISVTIYTMADWFLMYTSDPDICYIVNTIGYLGIITAPVAWFLLVLYYTGYDHYLNKYIRAFLYGIPVIIFMFVLTNPLHRLYYPDIFSENLGSMTFWYFHHGILYYLSMVFLNILIFITLVLIGTRVFSPTDLYRRQTLVLFVASGVPFIGIISYAIISGSQSVIDWVPFTFTILGIMISFGVLQYRLFSSLPLAYATIFSSMRDAVFATDKSLQILDLNPSAIRISGVVPRNAIGMNLDQILPEIFIKDPDSGKTTDTCNEAVIVRDGISGWYEISHLPLQSLNQLKGSLFILRDVTRRKKIEEQFIDSQKKLQLSIEGSGIGIWEYEPHTKKIQMSENLRNILGFQDNEVLYWGSDKWNQIVQTYEHGLFQITYEAHLRGERKYFEYDIQMLCKDGDKRWFNIRGKISSFDENANPLTLVGTALDVSEKKHDQEALKNANKKLSLLSTLTRHDILNQITGLKGYLELSLEQNDDSEIREFLLKCQALTTTITNQITFTRIYEEIGINTPIWQNVHKSIDKVRLDLPVSGLQYHVNVDKLMVFADPLFEKVLFTLVEDTQRHGEKATDIWFSYELHENALILRYEDNGVGIEEIDKKNIFKKNFGKNTGFGLFLAVEVLSITGMKIYENGKYGEGVRFEIEIPHGSWKLSH